MDERWTSPALEPYIRLGAFADVLATLVAAEAFAPRR